MIWVFWHRQHLMSNSFALDSLHFFFITVTVPAVEGGGSLNYFNYIFLWRAD